MPDFNDIPDLPEPAAGDPGMLGPAPRLGPFASSPTRRELTKCKRLAIAISLAWFALQLSVFGVRSDLARLSAGYIVALMLGPLAAGGLAVATASLGGRLSLGIRAPFVRALALLAPVSFISAGLLMPAPYQGGESGDLALGAACLNCTLLWALLPLTAAALSLRRTFAAGAVGRSALLGGGCGLIAAGMFTLHCPVISNWHLACAHGGAVLLSACLGGAFLPHFTRI